MIVPVPVAMRVNMGSVRMRVLMAKSHRFYFSASYFLTASSIASSSFPASAHLPVAAKSR